MEDEQGGGGGTCLICFKTFGSAESVAHHRRYAHPEMKRGYRKQNELTEEERKERRRQQKAESRRRCRDREVQVRCGGIPSGTSSTVLFV